MCRQEADGDLLLYASYAADEEFSSALISSEDSYVYIMSVVFSAEIKASLLIKLEPDTRTLIIGIGKSAEFCFRSVCLLWLLYAEFIRKWRKTHVLKLSRTTRSVTRCLLSWKRTGRVVATDR